MAKILERPATLLTAFGVFFWAPHAEVVGIGFDPANWIAAAVLLIPFAYCLYRVLRAPAGPATWPSAVVSFIFALLSAGATIAPFAYRSIRWEQIAYVLAAIALLDFARRNVRELRVQQRVAA